jgi:hypothetical protein
MYQLRQRRENLLAADLKHRSPPQDELAEHIQRKVPASMPSPTRVGERLAVGFAL